MLLLPVCVDSNKEANPFELTSRTRKSYLNAGSDNGMLSELYNRYGKRLYAYGTMSWKLNEDDAWDMVYKTLYKVLASYQQYQFENEDKFAAFVFKVFINFLRNHYRDNKKLSERFNLIQLDGLDIPDTESENESPAGPLMTALREVLDGLEDWQRILLLMRSEGRSYADIAPYVDRPEDQLKVYYQRLKQDLNKKINERTGKK